MIAAVFADILGLVAVVAVCGAMLYIANRIEPHWVAKDQRRFLTVAQELDQYGTPLGRKHEVRVHVDPDDDALLIRRRSMLRSGAGIWRVQAKSPNPPRGREVYILRNVGGDVGQMALRLPARSKMISRMDELLAATATNATHRAAGPIYEPSSDEPADDAPVTPDSTAPGNDGTSAPTSE